MADIFGFEAKIGRGFIESEKAVMIGENNTVNLVQNWNVQYQLSVNPIYECGTSRVYWSAKHASGNLTVDRVVADQTQQVRELFGWICSPKALTISAFTGQCENKGNTAFDADMSGTVQPGGSPTITPVNLVIKGSILAGVTFSGNSQQAYVSENVSAQFVGLEIDNKSETAAT